MNNVIILPSADHPPVINPRLRGRFPSGVIRMRTTVGYDDLAVITAGANVGKTVRITGYVSHQSRPEKSKREIWFDIESVGAPLIVHNKDTDADIGTSQTAIIRASQVRRTLGSPRPKYELPVWPARWEAALTRLSGGKK
jgi:hypothetical protein